MKIIYDILKDWKRESGYKGVIQFNYSYSTGILTVYLSGVGYLIGKAGCLVYKYIDIFKDKIVGFKDIKFEETDYYTV